MANQSISDIESDSVEEKEKVMVEEEEKEQEKEKEKEEKKKEEEESETQTNPKKCKLSAWIVYSVNKYYTVDVPERTDAVSWIHSHTFREYFHSYCFKAWHLYRIRCARNDKWLERDNTRSLCENDSR